jgi:hypothetical protein
MSSATQRLLAPGEERPSKKIMSELLEHSTVTLTLITYSHIINPMSGVAAAAMDEIVGQ